MAPPEVKQFTVLRPNNFGVAHCNFSNFDISSLDYWCKQRLASDNKPVGEKRPATFISVYMTLVRNIVVLQQKSI